MADPLVRFREESFWSRSLSLLERRDLLNGSAGEGAPTADDLDSKSRWRLDQWRDQSPFPDDEWFERRLRAEGLDQAGFLNLLATPAESLVASLPEDDHWLHRFLADFGDTGGRANQDLPELPKAERGPLSFARLVAPLLIPAANRVLARARELADDPGAPFDPVEVVSSLYTGFVPRLAGQVARVGVLELQIAKLEGELEADTPEGRFAEFIARIDEDEHRLPILEQYPVLARLATTSIAQWETNGVEFLERLAADWPEILERFTPEDDPGRLAAVFTDAGDRHLGGRTVFQLRFESGWRLIYKPRSIALDAHFAELTDWIAGHGGPEHPCPRTLARPEYGWCEFIHMRPAEDRAGVERFYERLGSLLALLYVLGATDFHRDNLIASGEHPVLVDFESILSPRLLDPDTTDATNAAVSRVTDSVLRVGILPSREKGDRHTPGMDSSGLGGEGGQRNVKGLPRWEGVGTDDMKLVRHKDVASPAKNRPTIQGEEVDSKAFLPQLLDGFRGTCRFLQRNRGELLAPGGPLERFAADPVRVILRHTRLYGLLLYEGTHPDVLRDALDRERVFDRIWYGLEAGEELDKLIPLIACEKRQLWNGDIPYYSTRGDSRDLWTGDGRVLTDFFAHSCLDEARRRLGELDEAQVEEQEWFIHGAMASLTLDSDPHLPGRRTLVPRPEAATADELLAEAEAVGRRLADTAIRGEDDATWIGLARSPQRGWVVAPLGFDVYSGSAGVSLFLAYLGAVSGRDTYTDLARRTAATTRKMIERYGHQMTWVGGYGGWGGMIHTWTHLGHLWDEEPWRAEAWEMVDRLPQLLADDECFDVLAGSAGAIRPLLTFGRWTGDPRPGRLAVEMGDYLLEHAMPCPRGIGWGVDISPQVPLTGFSHGAAGFTCALADLYAASGETRFRDAALESLAYENSLFSRQRSNWPDLRGLDSLDGPPASCPEGSRFMDAWCHGAPGIALGRLEASAALGEDFGEDVEAALESLRRRGYGGSHSLCHGDLGNLEAELLAALRSDDGASLDAVRRRAAAILDARPDGEWLCGVPSGLETPGLLVGLAGIGLQLLRLAAPERVPSVLTLEPPVGV